MKECGTELHVDLKQSGNFVDPKALHWYIYDPYGYCDVRIEQSGFRRYFSLPVTHAGPYNPSQGDISLERPTAEESGSGSISSSSSGTINPSNSQDKLNSNKKTGPKPRQRRRVAHPVHGENEEKKYFELCINMGVYEQHLGEINISSTKTDLSLFRSISDTYFRVRNGKGKALPFQRPIFTLLSKLVHRDFREIYIFEPQSVDFVKFQFDHRPGLGIIEEHSIPSISEINNGRYHYDPIPEGNYLPMPPDVFMHHFYSPDKFEHLPSKWLERLPKKLDTRLLDEDGDFGWGVHFREGMRWDVLSLLLFSITVVSMIGVLVVALVKGFETGIAFGQFVFGAAAFWVAGKTFLLQRESHGGVQKLR